jgi:hypothetical protein
MRFPVLTILALFAVAYFAWGGTASKEPAAPEKKEVESAVMAGPLPGGTMMEPLTPKETPVAVPEPVLASVLAACALSLLRRGRSY